MCVCVCKRYVCVKEVVCVAVCVAVYVKELCVCERGMCACMSYVCVKEACERGMRKRCVCVYELCVCERGSVCCSVFCSVC